MSSSTTREPLAIRLQNVSKIYKLYGSQNDQLIDVLKLQRFGFKTKTPSKEFSALHDISLNVPRGHRIGIIGANGAGKSTLLKLICGNFAPTSGEVEVNGTVQALMSMGLGFHPDYTGRENVESSLQYNGLPPDKYHLAMEEIIEFCELGDFFDQPFKTYSLGMQSRLMFAAATAISPDILIVDEVLGAGDAYFVAKCKARVAKLVNSGCTMLLVSHSMQQILELCTEAIWLNQGHVHMQGESFLVVKAYEEYINSLHKKTLSVSPLITQSIQKEVRKEQSPNSQPIRLDSPGTLPHISERTTPILLQEPLFLPHRDQPKFPDCPVPNDIKFLAPGGISRWGSDKGLKIHGFTIATEHGETNKLISMKPAKFIINVISEVESHFDFRYGFVFSDHMGNTVSKVISPCHSLALREGETHSAQMLLNPVQLGPGEYIISISLHKYDSLEVFNSTERYDLLARSSLFSVSVSDSMLPLSCEFFHSAEWIFKNEEIGVKAA